MKRYTQIYLLMAALCFAPAAQAQEADKAKPKLAVLPFQNKAGNVWHHGGAEAAQDVFVTELMKALQDVFVTELKSAKRFGVVDRKELEATAATQQLTLSGDIDPKTAVALGKSLGVQRLLTGSVTEYGVTDKSSASRKTFAVALEAKLIDTSTGEVVWADKARHVQKISVGGFGGGVDNDRLFKKTVTPCVKQLIAKWRVSKFFDIFVGDE